MGGTSSIVNSDHPLLSSFVYRPSAPHPRLPKDLFGGQARPDTLQSREREGLPIKWLFVNIGSVKPIKYTRHAKNRMRWHRITEIEVESALKVPEFLEPSVENRLNAWMKSSDKFLRVTYKEESDRFLVISAVKKNKGWR